MANPGMVRGVPERWRLLSGENNWQNLLNPVDSDLKQYITHYGAMAQATYDTFNNERLSKYTGTSKYSRRNLFEKVGLVKGNPYKYEAVKYIYAMSKVRLPDGFMLKSMWRDSWLKRSNWIGYVAVATDEGKVALGRRDILVAWRGTIRPIEWMKNLSLPLVPATDILGKDGGNANVHEGFLSIYTSSDPQSRFNKTSARDQVLSEVKKQVEKFKNEEMSITVTGHSLGAALATMNAADIVANGFNNVSNKPDEPCMVTTFKFGSPRVGDSNYRDILLSMNNLHMLDIQNVPDIVPDLPPGAYAKAGVELRVNSQNLDFLKIPGDVDTWHDLEGGYLPSVLGRDGTSERGLTRVNKTCGSLKDEYLVPDSWWIQQNKGMVQEDDGTWVLRDHEKDDDDDNDYDNNDNESDQDNLQD